MIGREGIVAAKAALCIQNYPFSVIPPSPVGLMLAKMPNFAPESAALTEFCPMQGWFFGPHAAECLTNLVKNKTLMTTSSNESRRPRPTVSIPFMLLGVLFCVCLIAANLLETKQVTVGPLELTAGLIVFPVSYIINDCMVEVWGYRRARLIIWLGFFMNFLFVLFGLAADALPGAAYWKGEEGFHAMFGLAPRIAGTSFLAFLVGSFLNAYVMSRMKLGTQGEQRFSLRAILSTIVGEGADSLVFFPLALGGVVPWAVMPLLMLNQVVLKTVYEIIALPVTLRVVRWLKRVEGTEVYDDGISYKPWRILDL